ncbi:MAG: FAD-dependent oxidoreductase [Bacteroidales bacterium]|nr:FAD-dependent oxidoreductase [Bacteroidales bacterium]
MGNHTDILIVGGGIIGLTSAYALARAGLSVEVRERGELGQQASWAGAGIIPPGNPERTANAIDLLRASSVRLFAPLSAELREFTGIDNGFRVCGGIEFLHPEDADLPDRWAAEGLTLSEPTAEELRHREPGLTPPPRPAYRFPGMGQVRNPWHMRALVAACEQLGVRLRPHTPCVWSSELLHSYQHVILAPGAWAAEVVAPLGFTLPVRPVRGQIVLFRPTQPVLSHVVIDGRRYLVPRADGRVLVGSTEEPEAGFERANTEAGVRGLIDFAIGLVPALAHAPIEKCWAGLRPGSLDSLPYLGRLPGHERVILAAGHFRAGVQLSPGTAQIVRDLVLGSPPSIPIDAFRPDRQPNFSLRPSFRS